MNLEHFISSHCSCSVKCCASLPGVGGGRGGDGGIHELKKGPVSNLLIFDPERHMSGATLPN